MHWLVGLLLAGAFVAPVIDATAAPAVAAMPHFLRAQVAAITPPGQEGVAGPLRITVLQVEEGRAAIDRLQAAGSANDPAADGLEYVTVYLRIANSGSGLVAIDHEDFVFLDSSGVVRRFTGAVPPDPVVDGELPPGESREGWITGIVQSGTSQLLLQFDSLSITGLWADAMFALRADSGLPVSPSASLATNDAGGDPGSPAVIGEQVVTEEWAVEIADVAYGQEVYDLYPASDYRTTALGGAAPELVPYWLALRLNITNNRTGTTISYLPPTAFSLAYADGTPVPDVRLLTPPSPDASGSYLVGGSREGWVAFELPPTYDGSLIRFLPYSTDQDARYLTWGDDSAPAAASDSPQTGAATFGEGDSVVTTEDLVRLRETASTSGKVIAELPKETALTVTGPAVAADDYRWYPVTVTTTGQSGFVAADFIQLAT